MQLGLITTGSGWDGKSGQLAWGFNVVMGVTVTHRWDMRVFVWHMTRHSFPKCVCVCVCMCVRQLFTDTCTFYSVHLRLLLSLWWETNSYPRGSRHVYVILNYVPTHQSICKNQLDELGKIDPGSSPNLDSWIRSQSDDHHNMKID